MSDLTPFQLVKMQEWKEFGDRNPSSLSEVLLENSPFLIGAILILVGLIWCP